MSEKKADSNGPVVGSSSESKAGAGLDLGLAALIDSLETQAAEDTSAAVGASGSDSIELVGSSAIGHDRYHYYKSLAEAEAFSQLIRVTEEDFNKWGEDDLIARLFWIRANARCGDFPRNMLGLSLQKLILDCTARASDVSRQDEIPSDIRLAVGDISDQLDGSPELRKKILASYNDFVEAINPPDDGPAVEEDLDELPETPGGKGSKRVVDLVQDSLAKYGRSTLRGLMLVFLPCVVYMVWIEFDRRGVSTTLVNYVYEEDQGNQGVNVWHRIEFERVWKGVATVARLQTPELPRVKRLGDLEGLSYTFDEIESKAPSPRGDAAPATSIDQVSSGSQTQSNVAPVLTNGIVTSGNANVITGGSRALPVVDTSGPIEPYMVEPEPDRTQDGRGARFPRRRNFVTEHFSSSRGSERSRSDYYRIDVDTSVFSRPNLSARRLSDLSRGDRVFVEDDSGAWLTVRSKEGNIGFVSKRDAVPDWR